MTLRIAPLTATVALAAVTLFAGCNKGASNVNGANVPNNNGARPSASPVAEDPKTSPTATPTTPSASSPTAAFKAYYEAIKNNDAAAVKNLFSKATLKTLEDEATQKNKPVDEIFKEGLAMAANDIPPTLPESRNEKIEGDRATLEIKNDKKGTWDTVRFVKEDDQWKISFAGEDNAQNNPK